MAQNFAADTLPGLIEFSSSSPAQLLADLSARGLTRCALLGGSQIHSLFLNARLIDELWLTLEPALFGRGTPLLAHATDTRLRFISQEKLTADTLLLKYEVLP